MKIESYPQGFLSLLGAQTSGRTPPEAADVAVSTVNLGKYLEHARRQWYPVTGTTINGAGAWPLAGPGLIGAVSEQDKKWLFWGWGGFATIGTTSAAAGRPIFFGPLANQYVISGALERYDAAVSTTTRFLIGEWFDEPILLSAGEGFGWMCSAFTAPNFTLNWTCLYQPVPN